MIIVVLISSNDADTNAEFVIGPGRHPRWLKQRIWSRKKAFLILLPNMSGRWCLVRIPPLKCLVFSHHTPSCNASFPSLTLPCLPDAFASSHCLSLLPSAFLKVFSMFYLCDNHTSVRHTAQCDTKTHTPLNLYLAGWYFSVGDNFDKVRLPPEDWGS